MSCLYSHNFFTVSPLQILMINNTYHLVLVVKTVFGIEKVLAFALPNAETAIAEFFASVFYC
jgi:hypothetical protein